MLSVKNIPLNLWDEKIKKYPEANFLQSSHWLRLHDELDLKIESIGIYRDNKEIGLMSMVIKDAKRGRYAEVSGGPLIDWTDSELVAFVTETLKQIGRKHQVVFIRVRPQLTMSDNTAQIFSANGFKKAPMHLHAEHTSVLHLGQSEEELLSRMRRQTRYEVKKSDRLNLKVSRHVADEKIDLFIQMQNDTAKRQGFVVSKESFLKKLVETLGDHASIYISKDGDQILNMALILNYGQEVDYFEAASSPKSYKLPGAYALLWRAIKDAKNDNFDRFNFWGIAYDKNPNNRYAGVTTFKRGFGGDDIVYVPAQDLILKPFRYAVNWLIETARRKKRRL